MEKRGFELVTVGLDEGTVELGWPLGAVLGAMLGE